MLLLSNDNFVLTNPIAAEIAAFLIEIGIPVRAGTLPRGAFLPGICVENGVIIVDESRLAHPGDLLHEAGHLAMMTPEDRAAPEPDMSDAGFEMAAIAWSYAAALHLGIDLEIVFHPDGYSGGSQAIIDNFRGGHYFGVPILVWLGLTDDPKCAGQLGMMPYPIMRRWLR